MESYNEEFDRRSEEYYIGGRDMGFLSRLSDFRPVGRESGTELWIFEAAILIRLAPLQSARVCIAKIDFTVCAVRPVHYRSLIEFYTNAYNRWNFS